MLSIELKHNQFDPTTGMNCYGVHIRDAERLMRVALELEDAARNLLDVIATDRGLREEREMLRWIDKQEATNG